MTDSMTENYQPMTPPLTLAERIADMLVMGVLIFWFSFLGLTPSKITQKGRPADQAKRPLKADDEAIEPLGVAAE